MTVFEHEENVSSENINALLNAFAKQYKKHFGNTPCEITIVGGGSIVLNYGFRSQTHDIDYFSSSRIALKDAIIPVADQYGLETDWMNDDFRFSSSFSAKLSEVSKHYRTLNNGTIIIRTIKAEDLIAMKMQSGREAGHDIADIVGIIKAEKEMEHPIKYDTIIEKANFLYGPKLDISDSLANRVKLYCNMSPEELTVVYEKLTQKAQIIKQSIIETSQSENIQLNRVTTKQLSQMIENLDTKDKMKDMLQLEIKQNKLEKQIDELIVDYKKYNNMFNAVSTKLNNNIQNAKKMKDIHTQLKEKLCDIVNNDDKDFNREDIISIIHKNDIEHVIPEKDYPQKTDKENIQQR